ncbi:MAG: flagellar biosynthesis protein FlhB [Spirochaetales bacterium]|nr:MAG: flagellar biosynthesis protein FlhB [Spirochaetales bacterium]
MAVTDEKAVALRYYDALPAPFILAKGKKHLAEKIMKLARENGIHIHADRQLADSLMVFEAGDFIPEEVFGIVAEIFAFVYAVEKRSL